VGGVADVEECVGLLRRFATRRGVHVTAVVHPRKEDAAGALSAASVAGSSAAQVRCGGGGSGERGGGWGGRARRGSESNSVLE
jgi:hypothetical protein